MENNGAKRRIERVGIRAGIVGVFSVTVPVFLYVGFDLLRILAG